MDGEGGGALGLRQLLVVVSSLGDGGAGEGERLKICGYLGKTRETISERFAEPESSLGRDSAREGERERGRWVEVGSAVSVPGSLCVRRVGGHLEPHRWQCTDHHHLTLGCADTFMPVE